MPVAGLGHAATGPSATTSMVWTTVPVAELTTDTGPWAGIGGTRVIIAGLVFAALAALLHVYIFVMESLTWTSPRTRGTFGTTAEEAETTKLLAFN